MTCSIQELRESEMLVSMKNRLIRGEPIMGAMCSSQCKTPYDSESGTDRDTWCIDNCIVYPIDTRILSDRQREIYRGQSSFELKQKILLHLRDNSHNHISRRTLSKLNEGSNKLEYNLRQLLKVGLVDENMSGLYLTKTGLLATDILEQYQKGQITSNIEEQYRNIIRILE